MTTRSPAKIAVVEDEPGLRRDLVEFLSGRSFDVTGVGDAAELYRLMAVECPDLILLDIRLPGESGLEIARRLRQRNDLRVVILTSQCSDEERVEGLNAGADAYLDKHTSLAVIEATCRSVLRRAARPGHHITEAMPAAHSDSPAWRLDTLAWLLSAPNGRSLKLTHAEHAFLATLLRRPGQPIGRPEILAEMGKADTVINRRNLDSCARRIRRKIAAATSCELPLESSYGFGYVFQGAARCTRDSESESIDDALRTPA